VILEASHHGRFADCGRRLRHAARVGWLAKVLVGCDGELVATLVFRVAAVAADVRETQLVAARERVERVEGEAVLAGCHSVSPWPTYLLSVNKWTRQGRRNASSPRMTASNSIRLFVVSRSAPDDSFSVPVERCLKM